VTEQHTEAARAIARYRSTYGSKLWRLTSLYKIVDKAGRQVRYAPNAIQTALYEVLEGCKEAQDAIRMFALKYRQGGVSTACLLWHLDEAIFHPGLNCGVLSHKTESLTHLASIIENGYKLLPERLRPALITDNKSELEFAHGPKLASGKYEQSSKMFVALEIRSTAVHRLHISEACFCETKKIRASLGAVPPTGIITAESTGNGVGDWGYITFSEAQEPALAGATRSDWVAKFYPWFIQAEYRLPLNGMPPPRLTDEERKLVDYALAEYSVKIQVEQLLWRRKMKRDLKDAFPVEFPERAEDAFMSSGKFFFHHRKIIALIRDAEEALRQAPPVEEADDYIIFENPRPRQLYVAGADVAEGNGNDFSTIKIINVTTRREAFRYKAKVSVGNFYRALDKWGRFYNNALLAPELNNHGHAVLMGLEETCHYPNLWYDAEKENRQLTRSLTAPKPAIRKREYGWKTTAQSRPLILDSLKLSVEGEVDEDVEHFAPEYTVLDLEFLAECLTFTEVDGKYQAAAGKNDDLVMAGAIANRLFLGARTRTNGQGSGSGGVRGTNDRENRL
jgi:hypothetical protein